MQRDITVQIIKIGQKGRYLCTTCASILVEGFSLKNCSSFISFLQAEDYLVKALIIITIIETPDAIRDKVV